MRPRAPGKNKGEPSKCDVVLRRVTTCALLCPSTSGYFAALWAHDFTETSTMGSVAEVGVDTLSLRTWHVDVGMDGNDAEKKEWMPKPRTGAGTARFYERGMPLKHINYI